jgi:hypothetical protein
VRDGPAWIPRDALHRIGRIETADDAWLAMSTGQPVQRQRRPRLAFKPLATLWGLLALLLATGCATPVGVERADPQSVHRELTECALDRRAQ